MKPFKVFMPHFCITLPIEKVKNYFFAAGLTTSKSSTSNTNAE